MDQNDIIKQFEEMGVVLRGHFILVSARHADTFVSKDIASSHARRLTELAEEAVRDHPEWREVELVAAPAVGAVALGFIIASLLNVQFIYAEQNSAGELEFGRGFANFVTPGIKVLVVEDIITTGKTVKQMIAAVESLGGKVACIFLLWLRGANDLGSDYPLVALVEKTFPTWTPLECPLCLRGVPITTEYNKHGREFLAEYGSDPSNWPANKVA